MNDLQQEFNDIYNKFYYHGQVFLPIKIYYKNKEYKTLIDFWSFSDLKDVEILEVYDEKSDLIRSFKNFEYSIDFKFYKLFITYRDSMSKNFNCSGYYYNKSELRRSEYNEDETKFFANYLKDVDISDYKYRVIRRNFYKFGEKINED